MNKKILIITGPTAVGKTELSLNLAKELNGEIINVDMGQFYGPLNIGTAKPDIKNQKIPHHLFDIINKPVDFSVEDFKEELLKKINDLESRSKLPIIVGGSVFYIEHLFFSSDLSSSVEPKMQPEEFIDLEEDQNSLWDTLNRIDPERALKIHKNDIYRQQRALNLFKTSGIKPSELKPQYKKLFESVTFLILERNRDELYDVINRRVDLMLDQGWINEIENLDENWLTFLKKKKIIGYNLIIDFLQNFGTLDKNDLIDQIKQKTRKYAKYQVSSLKRLEKKLKEIENNQTINIFRFDLSKDKENLNKEIINKIKESL